ncbi:MAG: TfoX/Sxy family protein [Bacteroidetes bacterium]|nr:TfoX/Sxy family protein [Bacteroidota bacterium]
MAYNEYLADRVKYLLSHKTRNFSEKKMMGGLAIMVEDKMCLGVIKNDLMARIDPENQDEAKKRQGCRDMDFTHRPMKGYIFVDPTGYDLDADLEYWVDLALEFNPKAKSSKKG